MKDIYEYEDGCCTTCHEEGKVRWKNLWVIGSEGIWVCHKCEMKLVRFVRDLMREHHLTMKEKIKAKKKLRLAEAPKQHTGDMNG